MEASEMNNGGIELVDQIDRELSELFEQPHDENRSLVTLLKSCRETIVEQGEALEPFARLKVPHLRNGGNAGAYSLLFTDIQRAQQVVGTHPFRGRS
jgi:hypothetical protein